MASYILDKAYEIAETKRVPEYRVVVYGRETGTCLLPQTANAGAILGVTNHSAGKGENVSIRKAGIARVKAADPIPLGTAVNIADNQGRIKAINEPPGTKVNCLGFAETGASGPGSVVEVFLSFHQRIA